METLPEKCARIVGALEDLAGQEACAVRARDFPAVLAISDRAGVLVDFLAANAAAVSGSGLRNRISLLQQERSASVVWLEREIAAARAELDETRVAERRVAQIAPAYGQGAMMRPRLSAVG